MSIQRENAYYAELSKRFDDILGVKDENTNEGYMEEDETTEEKTYHFCSICEKTEIIEEVDKYFWEKEYKWHGVDMELTDGYSIHRFEVCDNCYKIILKNSENSDCGEYDEKF